MKQRNGRENGRDAHPIPWYSMTPLAHVTTTKRLKRRGEKKILLCLLLLPWPTMPCGSGQSFDRGPRSRCVTIGVRSSGRLAPSGNPPTCPSSILDSLGFHPAHHHHHHHHHHPTIILRHHHLVPICALPSPSPSRARPSRQLSCLLVAAIPFPFSSFSLSRAGPIAPWFQVPSSSCLGYWFPCDQRSRPDMGQGIQGPRKEKDRITDNERRNLSMVRYCTV